MSEPKILLSGLGIPESPRWHEGRLWFCNWIDRQVMAVGLDGQAEVMAVRDPDSHPMGYSIDWLPDGRLLVTGDKLRRQDADGGLSNRRVFAEGLGPDGICLDAEGAVWTGTGEFSVVRVAEGGEVLQRVELPENRAPFALMLGGPDRRTLFILTAEWRKAGSVTEKLGRLANGPRTGEILALPVAVAGVGRP